MSEPFISPLLISPGVGDRRSRDFVAALSNVLGSFSTQSLLVQDPMTVDARLLPILTIELGMTEFMTPGLRETHVRQLLARAPEIHAWTGTLYGTRRALGALGITVDWTQWWEQTPKGAHDTHTVIAYVNEAVIDGEANLFSAATQYAVRRVIEATQRWSQEINFLLGAGWRSSAALVPDLQRVAAVMPSAVATRETPVSGMILLGALSRLQVVRCCLDVFTPPEVIGPPPPGYVFVMTADTPPRHVVSADSLYLVAPEGP